jgi:acyl-ACP thioesterase
MNLTTRKIAKIPEKFLKFDGSAENNVLPRPRNKIPLLVDVTKRVEMKIRKYHLDWNGHVNNNHYFKFLLEVLDPPEPGSCLKSVGIHIKNECLLGDPIEVVADQSVQPARVSILKDEGKVVAHALVQW